MLPGSSAGRAGLRGGDVLLRYGGVKLTSKANLKPASGSDPVPMVVLSACETVLGPDGGSEGLLGFAQVLLGRGARSLLVSLWKVDDTATALLMLRFYQNLLGKREGLKEALGRAEALREAKRWLRQLPRTEVEKLAGQLTEEALRASEEPKRPVASRPAVPAGDAPFAQPRYWAAFILIGDPD